jgi:ATP synthase protein I
MNKIEELQKKIDKIKDKNAPIRAKNSDSSAIADIAAGLVASVLVGVIIGLMLDKLFDSKPLFLIICIILSVTAAFRSIWKKYIK